MPVFKLPFKSKLTFGVKEDTPTPRQTPRDIETTERGTIPQPKILTQTGVIKDIGRDESRSALMPGKRISSSGKIYWETRRNRSDMPGKRI